MARVLSDLWTLVHTEEFAIEKDFHVEDKEPKTTVVLRKVRGKLLQTRKRPLNNK